MHAMSTGRPQGSCNKATDMHGVLTGWHAVEKSENPQGSSLYRDDISSPSYRDIVRSSSIVGLELTVMRRIFQLERSYTNFHGNESSSATRSCRCRRPVCIVSRRVERRCSSCGRENLVDQSQGPVPCYALSRTSGHGRICGH